MFRSKLLWIAGIVAPAALACLALYVMLEGWSRDFRVPVAFRYDALEYLMQVKGTLDNGWWWVHPRLSAPGVFEQVLYPSNTTVDQALVWIIGRFTSAPGLAINLAWMAMIGAGAAIASGCLSLLRVPRLVATAGGVFFALSPYSLARNIDHFSLATYLIPVPCIIALLLVAPRGPIGRSVRMALLAGCVLVGFNYTYYAFFACVVLVVGTLLAATQAEWRLAAAGLLCTGVIAVSTAVNLAPSVLAWQRSGRPAAIPAKQAPEADRYGLTFRDLVGPVHGQTFPVLREWTRAEERAGYAPEPERTRARLGLIGSLGLIGLLGVLFVPRAAGRDETGAAAIVGASRLALACFLVGAVGGLGSLFNLFVAADIRAYARLAPWIGFFGLCGLAVWTARFLDWSRQRGWGAVAHVGLVASAAFGLWEHSHAADGLNREHHSHQQEWASLHAFVGELEIRFPRGTRVFQLPALTFLRENGREAMGPYDLVKPYLVSRHLHWSYPALADSIVRWQQQVSRLPIRALAAAVFEADFRLLLIDRHGYADGGDSLVRDLVADAPRDLVIANERYIALDLHHVRRDPGGRSRLPRLGQPIAAATAGVPPCAVTTSAGIDLVGSSTTPFRAEPILVPARGQFAVTGWAVDRSTGGVAGDVDVAIREQLFPAFYGAERPDVADGLGLKAFTPSGFFVLLRGADVGNSRQPLSVRILSSDRACFYPGPTVHILAR